MDPSIKEVCERLEERIKSAYAEGVTVEESERLAAEFLYAQIRITEALRVYSLDARMRKAGLKAVKAAVFLDGARQGEKKPSDGILNAQVDISDLVGSEQRGFDEAEVATEALQNYLRIFDSAHVYFRQLAKAGG